MDVESMAIENATVVQCWQKNKRPAHTWHCGQRRGPALVQSDTARTHRFTRHRPPTSQQANTCFQIPSYAAGCGRRCVLAAAILTLTFVGSILEWRLMSHNGSTGRLLMLHARSQPPARQGMAGVEPNHRKLQNISEGAARPAAALDCLLQQARGDAVLCPPIGPSDHAVAVVHEKCFNPEWLAPALAGSNISGMAWNLDRAASGPHAGDPDVLVYQDVWTPAACSTTHLDGNAVVLTTHLTVQRLSVLRRTVHKWRGCVSASFLVCKVPDMLALLLALNADEVLRQSVRLHVVLGDATRHYPFNVMRNAAIEPWQHAFADSGSPGTIRQMRSFTVLQQHSVPETLPHFSTHQWCAGTARADRAGATQAVAVTLPAPRQDWSDRWNVTADVRAHPWLLMVDADALPSVNATEFARAVAASVGDETPHGLVVAVPAFEHEPDPATSIASPDGLVDAVEQSNATIAATFNALSSGYSAGRSIVFQSNLFAPAYQGRMAVDSWFVYSPAEPLSPDVAGKMDRNSTLAGESRTPVAHPGPFPIEYTLHFEPYFLAKPPFPRFDEFFRGRGGDKSSWFVSHIASGEMRMVLAGQVFLLCGAEFDDYRAGVHNDAYKIKLKMKKFNRRENMRYFRDLVVDVLDTGRMCPDIAGRDAGSIRYLRRHP